MKQTIVAVIIISSATLSLVASAQLDSGADAFIAWSQRHIIRINTRDPGAGLSDLRALKPVIGQARVVALGETHGTHELLKLRNRLFQYLVEELDFTAIAVESGVTESMLAEDFVMGTAVDTKSAARSVFSNNRTIAYVENLELIDWMRRHNASVPSSRKVQMGHVHRGPQKADVRFFPGKPPLWMGQYLDARLGNDLIVFGTAYRQADETLKLGAIDPSSFAATLVRIGVPSFALDLRNIPKVGVVANWLDKTQATLGYDGFIMLDRIGPAQLIP